MGSHFKVVLLHELDENIVRVHLLPGNLGLCNSSAGVLELDSIPQYMVMHIQAERSEFFA